MTDPTVTALIPLCNCPKCGTFAIVALTPAQRLAQPDETTHVCHPILGGCNHGFADDRTLDGLSRCYGCGRDVTPIEDDNERHCPHPECGSTDIEGAPHRAEPIVAPAPEPLAPIERTASDILITATEGGINYWAVVVSRDVTTYVRGQFKEWDVNSVTVRDVEDGTSDVTITRRQIVDALTKLASGEIDVHSDFVATAALALLDRADGGDFDASGADIVVQVAMFGKVIYG